MRWSGMQRVMEDVRSPGSRHVLNVLALRLLGGVATLVCSIVVARLLGPENKGIATSALILPMLLGSLLGFGLPDANVYYLHQEKRRGTLFINGLLFVTAMGAAGYGVCVLLLGLLRHTYFEHIASVWLMLLALAALPLALLNTFFVQYLRGLEDYRLATISKLVYEGGRLSLLAVFWWTTGINVTAAVALAVSALVIEDVYLLAIILRKLRGESFQTDGPLFRKCLAYGLKEYLGHVLTVFNGKIDMVILALFLGSVEFGVYAVAGGLGEAFVMLPSAISFVLLPRLAKARNAHRQHQAVAKSIRYDLLLLTPGWIAFLLAGPLFIRLTYGTAFLGAYTLSAIMIPGSIALSVVSIINKYYSGIGRPEMRSLIRIINLPIKGILLYIGCRWYGVTGAALAYTLSSFCMLTLTLLFYRRSAETRTAEATP